jgi:CheY-like chemotaxis protein
MDDNDYAASSASPRRIFVIEDNPEHSLIAMRVLREVLGEVAEIIVTENAYEAFYLLHHITQYDRPDLILIDLRIANSDGFDLMAAAHAHEACAQVPTLVITGSVYDQDIARWYELGSSTVLSKPSSRTNLREELVRIGTLARNSSRRRSTSH